MMHFVRSLSMVGLVLVLGCNSSGNRSGNAGGDGSPGAGGNWVGIADASLTDGGGLTGEGGGTWVVTGSGGKIKPGTDAGSGAGGAITCTEGVVGTMVTDCGYPYASGVALTSVIFNESEVLRAIRPSIGPAGGVVSLMYNDEHALTLGVRQVVVTSASGSTSTDFPVTPLATNPGVALFPKTGTTALTGDQSGLDPWLRPLRPVLYVTDITSDPNSTAGDWQMGGRPLEPTVVYGTWKSAVRTVDTTTSPATISVTPDVDPEKNDWNLGLVETIPPEVKNEGWSSEVKWSVAFQKGHSYRLQVIVHDGDQNKAGGDCGEACVVFCAGGGTEPPPTCPAGALACTDGENCPQGTSCLNGCCTPLDCPIGALACGSGGGEGVIPPESCPTNTSCVNGCCIAMLPPIP